MTSDASFPFGGTEPQAAPVETTEEGGSRRNLLLGGALGVVVLGAAGFLFLGGGGEAEDEALVVPAGQKAAAPQAAAPAPVAVVPAAATEQIGRNPFKARYVEPKEVAAPPAPSAAPSTAPTALPLPQQPVQVVVAPPPTQAPAEYPITYVGATDEGGVLTYSWKLDGVKDAITVVQGQRFGKYGELVVLPSKPVEGGAVSLQVGDSSPLTVAPGETIKVL